MSKKFKPVSILVVFSLAFTCFVLFFALSGSVREISIYRKSTYSVPRTLEPSSILSTADAAIADLIFEGLVRINNSLEVEPSLARSWSVSDDGTKYSFVIDTSVLFHDGSNLSVEDVIYSLKKLFSESSSASFFSEHIKNIRRVSDDSFDIELIAPFPPFLSFLAAPVAKIAKRSDQPYSLGTGAFQLVRLDDSKQKLVLYLKRFGQFHGKQPFIREMEIHEMSESQAIEGVKTGFVHDTTLIPMKSGYAKSIDKIRQITAPASVTWILALNTSKPPTADHEFRKCLTLAFKREEFVNLFLPDHTPAHGFIPPGLLGYSNVPDSIPNNPDLCSRYSGTKVRVDYPDALTQGAEMCGHFAKSFAIFGIETECSALAFDALLERIKSAKADISFLSQTLDLPDTDYFVSMFESNSALNFSNLRSPAYDVLMKQVRREPDRRVRSEIYKKINFFISNENLTINISYPQHVSYRHRCVDNLFVNFFGESFINYKDVRLKLFCLDRELFR